MTDDIANLSTFAALAEKAARRVGQMLADQSELQKNMRINNGRDIKLEGDFASEHAIIEILREGTPFAIFSEETGWVGDHQAEKAYWIVDPLDGSFNFYRDIPLCCISIALYRNDDPLIGIIFDLNHDELYAAVAGEGARLNGQSINVSNTVTQESSVFYTGIPLRADLSDTGMQKFARNLGGWKKVRCIGSAALSLAHVACGRGDAYAEDGIMWWDVAAGLALIKLAGGKYVIDGVLPDNPLTVFAWNGVFERPETVD